MKKISFKKIIAVALIIIITAAVFTGCALVEYQVDRDMEQVVLSVASFDMEYEVPFYVVDKNNHDKPVKYASGQTVMKVLRDHEGNPIHKPKVENGGIVYLTDKDDPGAGYDKSSNRYFIAYILNDEKTEAVSAGEYYFSSFVEERPDEYIAVWRNTDTLEVVRSGTFEITGWDSNNNPLGTPHEVSGNDYGLPTIYYINAGKEPDSVNWYYIRRTPVYETAKWKTEETEFTKQTLINYYGRSGSSLQENGYTLHEIYDELIRGIYTMHFMELEAENYVKSGEVEWGLTEKNNVKKSFYSSVNSALETIFEELFTEKGQQYVGSSSPEEESKTYPVAPGNSEEATKDTEEWMPDETNYLGLGTHPDRTSLVREGMRRWVTNMWDTVEYDYTISAAQKQIYYDELEKLRTRTLTTEELDKIYPSLLKLDEYGEYAYDYDVVWYLYGKSNDLNTKSNALRSYIGESETIDNKDVQNRYKTLLQEQKNSYSANIENYYSAVTSDSTILYFANDEYFYIKHVLLPFSDEAQAKLKAYKESGNFTDKSYLEMRENMAKSIKVYEHIDGENDLSTEKSVSEAYAHIKNTVNRETTTYGKERAFESMIYLYNTDPGIFNKEMGYAVTKTPAKDGGAAETYVIEFATAARELRRAYLDGKVPLGSITEPVLGEYGYHIIYLLKVPGAEKNTRELNDYLTAGNFTTVYDALSSGLLAAAREEAYGKWSGTRASYYENQTDYVRIFESRYEDLWNV